MRRYVLLTIVLLLVLTACAKEGSAPDTIQDYLKAKVASDADKLVDLACNEWEAQANADALSFKSVKAELKDMSCKENGKDGKYTLITCEGEIVAEYDGEQRSQSLSDTTYRALKEDGEWKMCGEQ
jgi:hypothetical protein